MPEGGRHVWRALQRHHIIYKASTKKFVLQAAIAWTWQSVGVAMGDAGSHYVGDHNLFVDEDGTGYLVHTAAAGSVANSCVKISRLSSDYLSVVSSVVAIDARPRAAPCSSPA